MKAILSILDYRFLFEGMSETIAIAEKPPVIKTTLLIITYIIETSKNKKIFPREDKIVQF
ncbi:hypothetical protein FFWV33_12515 [Flavobacterium faecale]|uniref:Uncharacterized protein n=1 Tax=Flavobacterium faecale TaxID=1355330 RepID=A0A2S1LET1_9FLAO|nr:hypothetical protein [Flavobacterium faecale]AWG22282.1 hypothetical protein FFWV33_12515 [Flavobacterium faecale]